MKTARSIEEEPERKNARDNADKGGNQGVSSPTSTPPARVKMKKLDASRIAKWKWQKGFAPNPTGKNGRHDIAAELARACFENNLPALYKAFSKALLKGNAYAFGELANRGYGKLKETHQLEVQPYSELSVEQMVQKIRQLEEKLGVPHSEPQILPPVSGDSKVN